jgi:hypothetical protein
MNEFLDGAYAMSASPFLKGERFEVRGFGCYEQNPHPRLSLGKGEAPKRSTRLTVCDYDTRWSQAKISAI